MQHAKVILLAITLAFLCYNALAYAIQLKSGDLFCTFEQGEQCAKDPGDNYVRYIRTTGSGIYMYCTTNTSGCSTITTAELVIADPR